MAEPDVYTELLSLSRAVAARRVLEVGCGTGAGLVSLYPTVEIVGVDTSPAISRCAESYAVGDWIDLDAAPDISGDLLDGTVVVLTDAAIRHDLASNLARRAFDGGALAVVVAVTEGEACTAADFPRLLAEHRLDAYIGSTAFSTGGGDGTVMLAVAPAPATRDAIATWWSERQPWERQLTRMTRQRPRQDVLTAVDDAPRAAGSARVAVVTEASGADPEALARTARSLLSQSFECWTWTIIGEKPPALDFDDPRIGSARASTGSTSLGAAVADAQFVALVHEGVELRPLAFEKWLWSLATHEDRGGVTGAGLEDRARLYRKDAIETGGGWIAAWRTASPIGCVPRTGVRGTDDASTPGNESTGPEASVWIRDALPFRNIRPHEGRHMLLVAPWMSLGGADLVNLDVLHSLRDAGWTLSVATTGAMDHSLYPTFESVTDDLIPLADVVPRSDFPRLLDYYIDSRRPDVVVVSQSELGYRLLPYLRSRNRGAAFVDLCHSETDEWYEGGYPRFSVEYGHLLDRTIVVSRHLRDWMIERGASAERVVVCHASVDHAAFSPNDAARSHVRRSLALGDEPVILWVGRMSYEKRPHLLPLISARLTGRGVRHTMLVVGDGPERNATERRAGALHGASLLFLGERDRDSVPALYAAGDMLVLPSRTEGISLTLFEAMSSGLPVVAARVGGQSELVTEDVGVLVDRTPDEEDEVDRFAAAIARVLGDPANLAEMGCAARARIETHFAADGLRERIERVLEDAIDSHRQSPRPVPDSALGTALASEALELLRHRDRRHEARPRATWRERTYSRAQNLGGPAYRWALRRRVPGIRVVRDLLRPPSR